jgi:hypothetical protein
MAGQTGWREQAVEREHARLCDAWKNPPPEMSTVVTDKAALARIKDPYERYERRIEDAWRT